MLEFSPRESALPIFSCKEVSYNVVQPKGPNGEYPNPGWEAVAVPVDEIDDIADDKLRDALWQQFEANESHASFAIINFVKPDGSFSHTIAVSRKPLNVTFTEDGVVLNEQLHDYREAKAKTNEVRQQQSAGFIARLFKKRR
jgi:hypothetical protein